MATYNLGSTTIKVPRDGTLTAQDSGASNTITFKYNNFSFDDPKFDTVIFREQGDISGSRKGDQQPVTGSFEVYFRQFTDGGTNQASIIDVFDGTGAVGSNWTKSSATHEEWNIDLLLSKTGTPYTGITDGANHVATLSQVIFRWSFSEGIDGDKLSVNFTAMGGGSYTGPS